MKDPNVLRRLVPAETAIFVIDIQERLSAAMPAEQLECVKRSVRILANASRELGCVSFYSEQYPKGLGPTLSELKHELVAANAGYFEKQCFSAGDVPEVQEALKSASVRDVVVAGMETHVCVVQTVRDFVQMGLSVHVPTDGVCSRREDHRQTGLAQCRDLGASLTTTETIVFDLLRDAKRPEFKALAPLLR